VFGGGLGKDEGFGEGVVIDGGDGVSSVGEWIDVVHVGVEGLCIDTRDEVVPEGEGVLLYVCDGGDGVFCEGMDGDRLLSKRVWDGEMDRMSMVVMKASVVYLACSVKGIYGKIFYT